MKFTYAALENMIREWGMVREDLRAAIVIGSRGGDPTHVDQWSDLDLIFFTTAPQLYEVESSWLGYFGTVWAKFIDHTNAGDPEWMAVYSGGLKVDYLILPAEGNLAEMLLRLPYRSVLAQGWRVLFDKTGAYLEEAASLLEYSPYADVRASKFEHVVNEFWVYAVRGSHLHQRGEIWRAKMICDCNLKQKLLTLIALQAASHQENVEKIRPAGKHLEDWAEAEILDQLPGTFAGYAHNSVRVALLNSIQLFHNLARQVGYHLQSPYPSVEQQELFDWLIEQLDQDQALHSH